MYDVTETATISGSKKGTGNHDIPHSGNVKAIAIAIDLGTPILSNSRFRYVMMV